VVLLPDTVLREPPDHPDKGVVELWDLSGAPRLLASSRDKLDDVTRSWYDLSDKLQTVTMYVWALGDMAKTRLEVWDLRTGHVIAEHPFGLANVYAVNSTHTHALASLSTDPQKPAVHVVIDLSGARKPLVLDGVPSTQSAAAFSPDGRFLQYTREGKRVAVWNLGDQQGIDLPIDQPDVFCFSPNGERLATYQAAKNEGVKVWDTTTGQLVQTISPETDNRIPGGPLGQCSGLRFTADGSVLGMKVNGQYRLARLSTGKVYKVLSRYEHGATVTATAVGGVGADEIVATASEDRTVGLWRAADGQHLGMLEGYSSTVRSLAFDQTGRRLLTRDSEGKFFLWNLERGESDGQPHVSAKMLWHTTDVKWGTALAWSADGTYIATSREKGGIHLWNIQTGTQIGTALEAPDATGGLENIVFSADSKTVAAAGADGVVRQWEVASGKLTASWSTDQGEIRALAFHPRENLLITAGADVRLWKGNQLVLKLDRHTRPVNHVCWSADGKTLVTAGDDSTVYVWNLEEMKAGLQNMGLGW
jgi:WD40 repeat protein